ncbi:acetate uptake transporter family protein [Algoriphagus taiwanensis]|uniref:DUF1700 domain-containing protein n=1 Tax=Algoriphagus taiwanensis TaxID=1445656 RepID=A0ABQ6PZR1_9BACT|nr:hypothetical protein Ataiwa_16970 [Algoriphagus taiwanensis]
MEKTQVFIDYYLNKIQEKDFDLGEVRKAMEKENFPEEEIRSVIKRLDNELQRQAFDQVNRSNRINLMGLGLVLIALGLVVTLGTFLGLIPSGNSFILAYGPIFGGLGITVSAYLSKKRNGTARGKFENRKR